MVTDKSIYRIRPIGEIYLPIKYRSLVAESISIKYFEESAIQQPNRVFNHLKRGGLALVSGSQEHIQHLIDYLQRKRRELVVPKKPTYDRKKGRRSKPFSKTEYIKVKDVDPEKRVMVWANSEGGLRIDPSPKLPFLIELIGEQEGANAGFPFLLSWEELHNIQQALSSEYLLNGLDTTFLASQGVLAPQSQETVELFKKGLKNLTNPKKMLDLGCGSGILTVMAKKQFPKTQVVAVDIMPEALATTKINLKKHQQSDGVTVCYSDLFQNLSDEIFDAILFNAPWVVGRIRSRSEVPTNDENQQLLTRFFKQVGKHLKPNGDLLLGYADHSGQKAVDKLIYLIEFFGFKIEQQYKARVATHRNKKKWQTISVYHLRQEC